MVHEVDDKVGEFDELDEADGVDEVDGVDNDDEVDEVNEVGEVDKVDKTMKSMESTRSMGLKDCNFTCDFPLFPPHCLTTIKAPNKSASTCTE